jgi:hypothetical protein
LPTSSAVGDTLAEMATIEPAALNLRFRQRESTSAPLDVGAFLRSSRATQPDPRATATEVAARPDEAAPTHQQPRPEIGVLPGPRPLDPEGPLVVLLQRPEFGVPDLGAGQRLPPLSSWHVRPTTFAWIAHVEPRRRGAPHSRVVQVLAACVALALPTTTGAAPPTVRGPVPPQPAVEVEAPEVETPTDAAAVEDAAEFDDRAAAEPAPAAKPVPTPTSVPASLASDASRDALTDAAWEGVDGFEVVLELKGGKVLRGRVGAVQEDTFTLIDTSNGQILVLAKSAVTSLRVYIPPPVPTKTGTGMLVGGGILTALGVPIFISGVVFLGVCPSCTYLHLPMLIIGGGALGGGIPMISTGVQRRNAFRRAVAESRVTPLVSRTRYGWNGGLSVRF